MQNFYSEKYTVFSFNSVYGDFATLIAVNKLSPLAKLSKKNHLPRSGVFLKRDINN